MQAAKAGESTIGIPQSVGQEFTAADESGGQTASIRDTLGPMVQDPVEAFLVELTSIGQEAGILDEAFQDPTVEDQADEQDQQADPSEFLSEEQIMRLVELFLAIPEEQRAEIENAIREAVPLRTAQRLEAAVRFAQQRSVGQGVQDVAPI